MQDKNNVEKISLEEYKKICKLGDQIFTNMNGKYPSGSKWKGKVIQIKENEFRLLDLKDKNTEWNISFSPIDNKGWVEILNSSNKQKIKKIVSSAKKRKEKLVIELKKEKSSFVIDFKIPKEVEEYYKLLSQGELAVSSSWFLGDGKGAEFYKLSGELEQAEEKIDSRTFSNFGSKLLNGNQINTAILRVKGASEGIVIRSENFNNVKNIEMEFYIQRLGEFLKKMYETVLTEKTIKAIITFEI